MPRHTALRRHAAMTRYLGTVALAVAAAVLTPEAKAEKVVVYREGQVVEPQDVAAVLGNTRGIRLLDDGPAAPKTFTTVPASSLTRASAGARETVSKSVSKARHASDADVAALSLPVRFAFDSTQILPAARDQLDALAKGIRLLPADRIVTVEGHTDAVGSDDYNLELSRARARAVRDYLVEHGIEASRLKIAGYGKERPIDPDPYAAINRRVQFRGS